MLKPTRRKSYSGFTAVIAADNTGDFHWVEERGNEVMELRGEAVVTNTYGPPPPPQSTLQIKNIGKTP